MDAFLLVNMIFLDEVLVDLVESIEYSNEKYFTGCLLLLSLGWLRGSHAFC